MTVATTSDQNDYLGDNSTATYAYGFRIYDQGDLEVLERSATNVEVTHVITSDYTVTGVSDSGGGNIVLVAGNLATGARLTIRRKMSLVQNADYRNRGAFFAETHEDSFDKLLMMVQQLQNELDRSIKVPGSIPGSGNSFSGILPADIQSQANKVVAVNGTGTGYALVAALPTSTVTISSFGETLIDDADSGAALTTLGLSAFVKTLMDDADAGTFLTTLGISAFAKTILDDASAGATLTTLGVTSFMQTVTDDTTALAARATLGVTLPAAYIGGLRTSNDPGDTAHDINVTAGDARDATNAKDLILASEITKRIDAVWAVGNDAGGLDTGTVANTTLYAVWLIVRTDTGVVDVLFSTSFTSPTMPTSYDYKRLIGAVKTEGSANVIAFTQSGIHFRFTGDVIADISDATITDETYETGTLSVPPSCMAHFYAYAAGMSAADLVNINIKTKDAADDATAFEAIVASSHNAAAGLSVGGSGQVLVNSSSQIEYAATEDSGTVTVTVKTFGFDMLTRMDP